MPTPVSKDDPLVGAVLHETYRVLRRMGSGGMGAVYEAEHTRLPRHFAIKVIQKGLLSDPVVYERFKREAELASSLGNPYIVQVSDFRHLGDGSPYLVMEFLKGQDLEDRLREAGRLPVDEIVKIMD